MSFLRKIPKRPLLWAVGITVGTLLLTTVLLRSAGILLAPALKENAAYFTQLKNAAVTWPFRVPLGIFVGSALLLWVLKGRAWPVLPCILGFTAALVTAHVNGVPLLLAVRVALTLLK